MFRVSGGEAGSVPYEAWAAEDPAWSARMDALAAEMDEFGDWLDDDAEEHSEDAQNDGAGAPAGGHDGAAGWRGEPGWLTPLVDGDWLTAHAPGADLAFTLERTDPAGLADEYAAVELLAAWARMASWAQAGMARAAAEVHTRLRPYTTPGAPAPDAPVRGRRLARRAGPAATEIAIRLGISRPAAQGLIEAGCAYAGPLGPVGDALADGLIDNPRARAFVEGLTRTPAQTALDVVETVLPTAPGRSVGQVRTDIAAALIALDPTGATARARTARAGRKVNRPQVLPDGMASLHAIMPAVDATALDLALDVAARTARTAGDPRTLDQLRADALASLAHTALATGHIGPPPHTCTGTHTATATGTGTGTRTRTGTGTGTDGGGWAGAKDSASAASPHTPPPSASPSPSASSSPPATTTPRPPPPPDGAPPTPPTPNTTTRQPHRPGRPSPPSRP